MLLTTYALKCASCHGERRYGGYAPPLIPTTLARKPDEALVAAILEGLPATQMSAFSDQLSPAEARALVEFFRQPEAEIRWSLADIEASRVEEDPKRSAISAAVKREELILVVERGSGSVSVLDGGSMRELDRFAVGRVHGGIKFDRGLHQALVATRDGTLVDYDLDRGAVRTRVKVGVNTRNIAISGDGKYVAAANQLPQGLVVLDGRLQPLATFPLPGQPSAVYQVPGSQRFMVTLRDLPHLYFISYPELKLQFVELPEPFEDFIFIPGTSRLVASSRKGNQLTLYDFERNEILATLGAEGLPHLFSGELLQPQWRASCGLQSHGRAAAFDHRYGAVRSRRATSAGRRGLFHAHASGYALPLDRLQHRVDPVGRQALARTRRPVLIPEVGKKSMHVEFTADGAKALVSIWHENGAVVVYDSSTLDELQRLPYAMPVGKYNAANKTRALY